MKDLYNFISMLTAAALLSSCQLLYNPDFFNQASTYIVTYNNGPGTPAAESQAVTFPATTVGTLPVQPAYFRYVFDGWYTQTGGGGKVFTASTPLTKNITVYADWYPFTGGENYNASQSSMISSANWQSLAYGNGVFLAVAISSTAAAYSTDGINWYPATLPGVAPWMSVTYGNGVFVAISQTTSAAYSTDGINWHATTIPFLNTGNWTSVAFGNGVFVVVADYLGAAALYSTDGKTWTASSTPPSSDLNWNSVTFGNPNGIPTYAAVCDGGQAVAYSSDGNNWTTSTAALPSSANWQSVAYGNGIFVAVVDGATTAAYSTDGKTWAIAETLLPSPSSWMSVAYGNGVFVAIAQSGEAAYSIDGKNWTTASIPLTGSAWESLAYGNPNGISTFVAVGYNTAAFSTN